MIFALTILSASGTAVFLGSLAFAKHVLKMQAEEDRREEENERRKRREKFVNPEARAKMFAERRRLLEAQRKHYSDAYEKLPNSHGNWNGMMSCDRALAELAKEEAGL